MLAAVDNFLLGRVYVPLSRFAGRRFGSTACTLSRACIPPMVVAEALRCYFDHDAHVGLAIFLMCLVTFLATLFFLSAAEADCVPNRYALEPPVMRLLWLFWTPLDIFMLCGSLSLTHVCGVAYQFAVVSVIYFRAVPAPPPKKSHRSVPQRDTRFAWHGAEG